MVIWKRTRRENDENWAHYYAFGELIAEQDANPNNWDNWKSAMEAFKGKQEKINKSALSTGYLRTGENANLSGFHLLVRFRMGNCDKGYFHFMTEKNPDFVSYEDNLWKPVAQKQILDGYRKFWGLAEIISKDDPTKKLNAGHTILHLIL